MTQDELKILENLEKEIQEKEYSSFSQIVFCRKHKFEMEAAAQEYRREVYHQCRLKVMAAIDELKNEKRKEVITKTEERVRNKEEFGWNGRIYEAALNE